MDELNLIRQSIKARERSYSPYSGFMVGAALLTKHGYIYHGCNIENAAYSPSICAERAAFAKAVSEGEREFAGIAIAGWPKGGNPGFAYPCGACRQTMMEFCDPKAFKVLVVESELKFRVLSLEELLPHGFGPKDLS